MLTKQESPLDVIVLYCVPQDDKFVVLLPSEY